MSEIKVGLEIHCQLTYLQSKLFCSCYCDYRFKVPNSNVCPVCSGLPGTLPLLNQNALSHASLLSIALGCNIPNEIIFYRKNYFYLDLPKNFQLTQYNAYGITSIGVEGKLEYGIDTKKYARIRRIQLEEDPGRLVYENNNMDDSFYTLIDYNRAGVSLVEIVTEPDFTTPKDVRTFLNKITSIVEHLRICNTRLEGAVRCDVNVSIGEGKRVEIKNIGSFKEVEKAVSYEITRQKTMSFHQIEIKPETRQWDDARKITKPARAKETEEDYRYFPEPDIPVVILDDAFLLALKRNMPELPDKRKRRFVDYYKLSDHVSQVLIESKELADFFESAVSVYPSPKAIANWIVSDLMKFLNGDHHNQSQQNNNASSFFPSGLKIEPKHIAELAKLVDQNTINRNTAKELLNQIIKTGEMPSQLVENTNASKIDDKNTILDAIEAVFRSEKSAVNDARQNSKATNFLLGKIMQLTKGKADPKIALDLINKKLIESS
ncbi:MAG TPA: Asp-tRNA(Asn)/Glu-tRNA(Gln) amidotransferase subunit GatB [Nitrososphaeraceae archaeon]|nr:Asp-tRNA(Asn)/Glu-tRNA(Gln) amidotransferase subunit GatB [Nitrososphaeraceae archaeon]